ncbi:MAG TPA: response regulator [Elusimicrobiota bacterium]|nr:response regulator [Elusimicrobiota bacterium]
MARVLLIEDDPTARELLRVRLERSGYEIQEALDGDEGLLRALRRPDLIIMDIRLPKINGWELCRMLKSEPRTQHIPIVMVTGCSQPIQKDYGRDCGADAYLVKPWDPKELVQIVRKLLARSSAHDPRS